MDGAKAGMESPWKPVVIQIISNLDKKTGSETKKTSFRHARRQFVFL
jgi:hypothetical protein